MGRARFWAVFEVVGLSVEGEQARVELTDMAADFEKSASRHEEKLDVLKAQSAPAPGSH